jgi:hypothetical protein
MSITRPALRTNIKGLRKTYLWVSAWLIAGAVLAILLLANSIRDYQLVSKIIDTEQVRHETNQHVAALEQRLRLNALGTGPRLKSLIDDIAESGDRPAWIELRAIDGSLLESSGKTGGPSFSQDEVATHSRNHESLFKVVATSLGDIVVEVFPVHLPTIPISVNPAAPPIHVPSGPATLLALEIAMPLDSVVHPVFWPILLNLIINCAVALALIATVVLAGLGFRSYDRGKHLEEQLEIARQVQCELLPSLGESFTGVQLATEYRPAGQVGGDFYDVFRVQNSAIALVMGDVSGKGVPAALLMGVIHGVVRAGWWSESASHHERESGQLNRFLCERSSGDRFASMFWCYYDPIARLLRYVNCGHCPPLLARNKNGELAVDRLEAGGPVLGMLPAADYEQTSLELSPGDLLVMYSDGLVEATNSRGEEYGEKRLRDLLTNSAEKSPAEIRQVILASLEDFSATLLLRDDLTFVVVQFGLLPGA